MGAKEQSGRTWSSLYLNSRDNSAYTQYKLNKFRHFKDILQYKAIPVAVMDKILEKLLLANIKGTFEI